MSGTVRLEIGDGVATIVFDRPAARNAMTFAMYAELDAALARVAATSALTAVVFRGAGGTFVAGTDISEFRAFATGEDGLAYERKVEATISAIEALAAPTIAVVDGVATGGGLIIACACDLRLAAADARFGAPIARTVGNCLSRRNTQRVIEGFGAGRTARMLLLAELIDAQTAIDCGFALPMALEESLESRLAEVIDRLRQHAPLTMRVAKQMIHTTSADAGRDEELMRTIYGSDDFREGVEAFLAKRGPKWSGR